MDSLMRVMCKRVRLHFDSGLCSILPLFVGSFCGCWHRAAARPRETCILPAVAVLLRAYHDVVGRWMATYIYAAVLPPLAMHCFVDHPPQRMIPPSLQLDRFFIFHLPQTAIHYSWTSRCSSKSTHPPPKSVSWPSRGVKLRAVDCIWLPCLSVALSGLLIESALYPPDKQG